MIILIENDDYLDVESCSCGRDPTVKIAKDGMVTISCDYYGCNNPAQVIGETLESCVDVWNRHMKQREQKHKFLKNLKFVKRKEGDENE